ncbi:chymotrypsin BI-like [Condylostylus longicornis]|uniref:chymotrypsin BI-like n=1 Tax=Condylostylus longicornis TaxID=2530218 RepID=UPI00244E5A72|nr:chymotrypsin BI-like [Condylostylus longicornis]
MYPRPKIIRGIEAASNMFPYQVALTMLTPSHQFVSCGGSLIHKSWVLTAAHCLDEFVEIEVILGAHNRKNPREPTQQRFKVYPRNFIIHSNSPSADIGLIRLPAPAVLNKAVRPIQLPCFNDVRKNYVGNTVIVSGWGQTKDESNSIASLLKYAVSKIIPNRECTNIYEEFFNALEIPERNIFCAKGISDSSVCSGDSGGPLVSLNSDAKPDKLIGVISFAMVGQCAKNFPQGFTRVDTFLRWINEKTRGDVQIC